MGKTPGKDARASKATYPAVHGIDATRKQIELVHRTTHEALEQLKRPASLLGAIADLTLERRA